MTHAFKPDLKKNIAASLAIECFIVCVLQLSIAVVLLRRLRIKIS